MVFAKTDAQHFVNNVELLPSGEMQWNAGRGTMFFLILKTPVGFHPALSKTEAQDWLSGHEAALLETGSFSDQQKQITGSFLPAAEFFRSGSRYKISGSNVCFFVYGASVKDDVITVYAMNNVGGDLEYCAERLARVTVFRKEIEVTRRRGVFRQEKKRLLRIRIESNDVLTDDDLRYEAGGYVYPVTHSMMQQPFYLEMLLGTDCTFLSRSNAKIEVKDG